MLYPQEVIEDIRMGNDIVDIISGYTKLTQKGNSHLGLCPFHKEKTPSFSVSQDKQLYHCFGCGASGNVISFIMQIENYDFLDSIRLLANRIHYTLPEATYNEEVSKQIKLKETLFEINKVAARFFYKNLTGKSGEVACKYLDNRKIAPNIRVKYGLGYALNERDSLTKHIMDKGYELSLVLKSGLVNTDKYGKYYDRFVGRLMFPIFNVQGNIVGFGGRILESGEPKYLNSPDTPVFEKSKNLYSINFARLSRNKELILVEGYMDVISLYQEGFTNVVASLGTAFNNEHVKVLKRFAESVVLLFDSDTAGTTAALRAIPVLEAGGIKVKVLQLKDAKDPDEYIKKFGKESFSGVLERALSSIHFQVSCIQNKYDLSNTEQKIKFTLEVAKLFSKIDNAVEREAYVRDIASLTGLSTDSIFTEIEKLTDKSMQNLIINKNKNLSYAEKNLLKEKGSFEARKMMIYLATLNKETCMLLKKYIMPCELIDEIYIKLFQLIYDLYEKNHSIRQAELVNYFEVYEEQKIVSEIFSTLYFDKDKTSELNRIVSEVVRKIKITYLEHLSRTSTDLEIIKKLPQMKKEILDLNINH